MWMIYKSIGNPAIDTPICICPDGYWSARREATRLGGKWWGRSQASPYFIRKVSVLPRE